MMNIHYVGCDILSSAMCMDKEIMHILCDEASIPCADYVCLKKGQPQPTFAQIQERIPLPWIVKPCNAGSSYGVHFVEDEDGLPRRAKTRFSIDGRGKILVEKAIDGFEIGCAVMGNEVVETGSVDEIEIESAFFDFEGKYAMKGAEIHCPARLDDELFEKARLLAKDAYRAMGCTGLARVDMFVTGGDIVLNELNTIPGFTATSRYPTMMQEAGLGFSDLIDRLIALAMERQVSAC